MSGNPGCAGVKRVLQKLENCISNGNYYEAHQMYRTLYFRYLGQKKYLDLIELLFNGSKLLLEKQQYTSGADLGILLIDVLNKSDAAPSPTTFDQIVTLFELINPNSPERETYVQNAIRWSARQSNQRKGHPDLHKRLARVYWKEKNYTLAKHHFLYTKDGEGCAAMLLEIYIMQGYSNEFDLYVTQTVLQYLCLSNKKTAKDVFKTYIAEHPKVNGGPPYTHPLFNFLYFLFESIETRKFDVFNIICQQYLTSLNRDSCFLQYIEKIGQLFFNAPVNQPRSAGLFGSLLQSFLSGLDEDTTLDVQNSDSLIDIPEID